MEGDEYITFALASLLLRLLSKFKLWNNCRAKVIQNNNKNWDGIEDFAKSLKFSPGLALCDCNQTLERN